MRFFVPLVLFLFGTAVFAAPVEVANKEIAEDASSVLIKDPVANANQLLYDIDAQLKTMIDEKAAKSEVEVHAPTYSRELNLDIAPRQSAAQPNPLVNQLEVLEKRLLVTMNELQTRRRMVSYTILRQMYNSVSRVRLDITRLQTRFSHNQQVSHSVPTPAAQSGFMKGLQQQVANLQNSVNEVINRVSSSFQRPNAAKPANPNATGHHQLQS